MCQINRYVPNHRNVFAFFRLFEWKLYCVIYSWVQVAFRVQTSVARAAMTTQQQQQQQQRPSTSVNHPGTGLHVQLLHLPGLTVTKGVCAECRKTMNVKKCPRTKMQCTLCKVILCLTAERNCFEKYHAIPSSLTDPSVLEF